MENEKIVVGLDIGTTKIAAIVGRKNEYGKLEILGMGKAVSDGVIRGEVTNIERTVAAITRALTEAEETAGINIGEVIVGIAGQHIRSSKHHGVLTLENEDGEVAVEDLGRLRADMYKIVTPPGNDIIHVMPQDYTVDFEAGISDPVGMSGRRLEADFHVITAHSRAIKNINKCVKRAVTTSGDELRILNLILEPIASSLSTLSEEEKEAGVVLVDIGGGTTDVAVFHNGIIRHTAVIPFGGNIVTQDIKEGCMVLQQQAEQLKERFGRAMYEERNGETSEIISIPGLRNRPPKEISIHNLSQIIRARMEEIIELVYAEIVCSGYKDKLAGGIVVTGGGSMLQDIQQLFEFQTGMETRIGYPNEHLGKSKAEQVKSPMYATGVGLVLAGFRALDDRENRYQEFGTSKTGNKVLRKDASKSFFREVIDRTRGFLIDDVSGKSDY